MYASIRDGTVLDGGYASIKEGLADLDIWAIEADFDRDCSLADVTDTEKRCPVTNEAEIAAYQAHLKEHGVTISALLLHNNLNADDLDDEHAWMAAAVRAAHAMGVPAVRIDSAMSGQQELPFDERVGKFVTGIKRLIADTADTPVDLGIENHGYQGNDPEFLHGVFGGVGSDRIGMTLDTGNFYWRGHPMDKTMATIEEFAKTAKHTHVKNINYPEECRNVEREMGWEYGKYVSPIPDGDVDHATVVKYLKAAGYDRDFCIEDESLGKFSGEEKKEVLRRDAAYVKSLM